MRIRHQPILPLSGYAAPRPETGTFPLPRGRPCLWSARLLATRPVRPIGAGGAWICVLTYHPPQCMLPDVATPTGFPGISGATREGPPPWRRRALTADLPLGRVSGCAAGRRKPGRPGGCQRWFPEFWLLGGRSGVADGCGPDCMDELGEPAGAVIAAQDPRHGAEDRGDGCGQDCAEDLPQEGARLVQGYRQAPDSRHDLHSKPRTLTASGQHLQVSQPLLTPPGPGLSRQQRGGSCEQGSSPGRPASPGC